MALTGRPTVMLAVLIATLFPVALVLFWNRLRARGPRYVLRTVLLFGSQLSAIALVAILVNDAGNFYTSWRELLGERHTLRQLSAAPGNQDGALVARLAEDRRRGHGTVVSLAIPSTSRGIGTYRALVYLPAQYGMAAYQNRTFPVVELIAGSPGTPQTWTHSLAVAAKLDAEIKAGRSVPLIAVMPTQDVAGGRDTQCVDVVGGPAVDHYLTVDVRSAITRAYRANSESSAWALMGYSSGGFCATNLAMRHPDYFSSAVSLAGYGRPAHDHQTGELFGNSTQLRNLNTPLWRAKNLPPPDIALLLIASRQDPQTARDARDLVAEAVSPLSVSTLTLHHGGHNFEVWRAEEPIAFAWLSRRLTGPLAPPPLLDNMEPSAAAQ
ncbi:alpha/beta fold hydrolase [Jatrophihabitans telluris]|uniref:Alpha/beta fold hydrolase n=1 Tax=Jatrophihabitans telluris TaxID=2038343 RepID=A0ABY4QZR5_9ACTN|nr:alpha/beta fold hydrolase [Jatrophihabitans telluris]UQX89018.1 alpha/beta fold hydrolase [Jatrophihabitans telluris]